MNRLNQYATIAGLGAGNYDGQFKLEEITKNNNFGLGTFDGLDGELIGFDNHFYRVRSDGSVNPVKVKDLTPFASLVDFRNPVTLDLPVGATKESLMSLLSKEINPNRMYALKITGEFSKITTRTLSRQTKPYKKLADVAKKQQVLTKTDQKGTIVGYLTPEIYNTINAEGLHLHFLNAARDFGGHVLDFVTGKVKLEAIEIDELNLVFDSTKKAIKVDQVELHRAEN